MPRPAVLSFLLALLVLPVRAEGHRPFDAESAWLLGSGSVELEMGAAVGLDAHRVLFPDAAGRSLVVPRLGLRTGLGPWGELRVEGDALFSFDPDEGETKRGAGDWRISTKLRLGPESDSLRWAALVEVKVPVASDEDGLGTDLTDVALRGLMEWRRGRSVLDLDLGLQLVGAPFRERSQQDLLVLAASWRWELRPGLELGAELSGRQGGDFLPARSVVRAGAAFRRGSWRFDGAVGAGLRRGSPGLEVRGGATYRFDRGGR